MFLPGGGLSMLHPSLRRARVAPTRPTQANQDRVRSSSRTDLRKPRSCNARLRKRARFGSARGQSPEALPSTPQRVFPARQGFVQSNSSLARRDSDSLPHDDPRPGRHKSTIGFKPHTSRPRGRVSLTLTHEPHAITWSLQCARGGLYRWSRGDPTRRELLGVRVREPAKVSGGSQDRPGIVLARGRGRR